MAITVAPPPYQDPKGRSLGARLAEHGATNHIGDHGRVVRFTIEQIPGAKQEFEFRNCVTGRVYYAILRYSPAGVVHSWTFVDRLEAAQMVADGTHPKQAQFTWTGR